MLWNTTRKTLAAAAAVALAGTVLAVASPAQAAVIKGTAGCRTAEGTDLSVVQTWSTTRSSMGWLNTFTVSGANTKSLTVLTIPVSKTTKPLTGTGVSIYTTSPEPSPQLVGVTLLSNKMNKVGAPQYCTLVLALRTA